MKNLILGSLLLLLFAPTLTAQNIAVMYNGGESEMAQGGSMTVYYKTNESTICDIFFNLKPDGQAEGKSYKLTYTKVNQKGNTNWGISTFCDGDQCFKVDEFDDSYSKTVKVAKYEKGTYGFTNEMHATYTFKGALQNATEDFRIKVDVTPEDGNGNSVSFFVDMKHWSKQSLSQISQTKVSLLSEADGVCAIQHNSSKSMTVEVYNILGSLQYRGQLPAGVSTYRLPVRLAPGINIFRVSENGKAIFTQKLRVK
ncbi:MAG: hypothetical protein SPI72_07190 [Porphyromonas sp.]|nr:hypothetical protein [Porphyromonas sp.]